MKNRTVFFLFAFLFLSGILTAQNQFELPTSIRSDGLNPDASAMFDVQSTTQGMLVPRMTTEQRTAIVMPADGLLVFDTQTGSFWFYKNERWNEIAVAMEPTDTGLNDTDVPIPDNDPIGDSSIITLVQPGVIEANTQINVTIDITHSWDQDLEISLKAPDGTTIDLSSDNGGIGDNYTNTCFSTEAVNPITGGSPPFSGKWVPEQAFSNFISTTIAGDWTLKVVDDEIGVTGQLNWWSIEIVQKAPALAASLSDRDGDTGVQVEESPDEDIIRFEAGGNQRLLITPDSSLVNGLLRVEGSFVSGNPNNLATGSSSFVGGGNNNTASNFYSFVSGEFNNASGSKAFVGGGNNNVASGISSFVGGGSTNVASGSWSFVGGGQLNDASGTWSFVGGGQLNEASGNRSFVGGSHLLAKSFAEAAFGAYNTDYMPASPTSFDANDRLFVIGNGPNSANRSNAVTVLKNGNVGIGTDTPDTRTEVSSDTITNLRVTSTSSATDDFAALQFLNDGGTGFHYRDWEIRPDGGDLEFRASEDNFVTSTLPLEYDYSSVVSQRQLIVDGDVKPLTDDTYDLGSGTLRWGDVYATNGTINTSDAREKENIQGLAYGLAEVMQLHPVSFTWKSKPRQGTKLGLVAQEVQTVIGEVVKEGEPAQVDEDGTVQGGSDRLGIYYSDLIPVLIKGMQEQQVLIEELKVRISKMEVLLGE